MATPSIFGHALLRERQSAGLSQEALAARSGLSVRGISDLERGARLTPRLETIRMLADALDLDGPARADMLAAARPELAAGRTATLHTPSSSLAHPPLPLTSLIGRDDDVANVCRMLEQPEVRLLTLTGPGGVGKTRLALAVARSEGAGFAHGVAFVDLSPVHDPAQVTHAVAAALGVRERGGRALTDLVRDELHRQHRLIVLDNFEQVTAAAPLVVDLLQACPLVKMLVTSRAMLHVTGEFGMPVSPLSLPAQTRSVSVATLATSNAVRLFRERATAVQPRFTLTERNAAAVAEICRRLDGLPLAIELAAARTNLLPPEELLARLDPRLPMLRGGPLDQPDRLRTMRDAIVWSLDLLAPDQRDLFAQLAVFSGGFSLAAAEAVGGQLTKGGKARGREGEGVSLAFSPTRLPASSVPSVFDSLGSLVDQSLVQSRVSPEGEARFWMLETIREVAGEELESSGQSAAIHDRHAAYFGDLAERAYVDMWGPRQRDWLNRLETEHDNLRAALSWLSESGQSEPLIQLAGALGSFWLYRGHASEGRSTLERVLSNTDLSDVTPVTCARALVRLATLLTEQGEFDRAIDVLNRARLIRLELGDREGLGHIHSWLGAIAERRGDDVAAEQRYAEAHALFGETNDDSLISYALANLSDTAYRRGDIAIASVLSQQALAAARAADDAVTTIVALGVQAQVELAEVRTDSAISTLDESLTLSIYTGYQSGIANSLGAFAAIALHTRQLALATRLLAAAETVRETAGIHRFLNQFLFNATLSSVQREMDAQDFAAAWTTGQSMTLTQAIDDARSTIAGLGARNTTGQAVHVSHG